jgi:hypothetical protein
VEYAEIRQDQTGERAGLYVHESEGATIVRPFLRRSMSILPFSDPDDAGLEDILTPEYTGPLSMGSVDPGLAEDQRREFSAFCRENAIVSEFAHLHPFDVDPELLCADDVTLDREIVYVDLEVGENEMWRTQYSRACRYSIHRAERENVRVFEGVGEEHVREFHRIYTLTMDQVGADRSYYFPLDYFLGFYERLPDNARFVLAELGGRIIAGSLFLHDDRHVYYHLSGSDRSFRRVRPVNAIIHHAILWARAAGKRDLILGGGYRPNDSLFEFKASFSPLRAGFHVYRHVHMPEAYERLCAAWSRHHGSEIRDDVYFPAYRAPVE